MPIGHTSRSPSIAAHRQDYAVAYLLAYALGLDSKEHCNALVKRAMVNALPGPSPT